MRGTCGTRGISGPASSLTDSSRFLFCTLYQRTQTYDMIDMDYDVLPFPVLYHHHH